MSKVALSGNASGTGTFTIASPNSNTDRTLTLPDNTGTILTTATAGVPVNGPAFSAYPLASQSIPNATFTKLQVNTEFFDTNGNFDVSNYRFTPTVAGYYQLTGTWYANTSTGQVIATIYKNGTAYQGASLQFFTSGVQPCINSLIYLNGSTDYVELYVYQSQGASFSTLAGRSDIYYFQGFLARSAT
jgi:hypothetical protein